MKKCGSIFRIAVFAVMCVLLTGGEGHLLT